MKRITKKLKVYETKIACYDKNNQAFFTVEDLFFEKPTKNKVNNYLVQNDYDVDIVDIIADAKDIVVEMDADDFVQFGNIVEGSVDMLNREREDNGNE